MSDLVSSQINFTEDQVQLIKDTVCQGATNDELKYFLYVAKTTGLNPFTKQIYSVKRWDSGLGRETRTIQISIDGSRVVAERSGKYAGQLGPFWCGEDGEWKEIWISNEFPYASKVGVMRNDFKEPLWAIAKWDSYVQTFRNKKTGQNEVGTFWRKFPELMLAKVAESLALRKAFPQDLGGLMTSEEMDQANNDSHDYVKTFSTPALDVKKIAQDSEEKNTAIKYLANACSLVWKDKKTEEKIELLRSVVGIESFNELKDAKYTKDVIDDMCIKVSSWQEQNMISSVKDVKFRLDQ